MPIRKKCFWRSGSAESIGFVCTVPIIIMLFAVILNAAQISCVSQALESAVYSAGRVAVVTDDKTAAKENAQQIAEEIIYQSAGKIEENSVSVNLEIIPAGGGVDEWVKGNLCKVSVSCRVNTGNPFNSGVYKRDITMMIERPASEAVDLDTLNGVVSGGATQ